VKEIKVHCEGISPFISIVFIHC